jgi:hypothetical protein
LIVEDNAYLEGPAMARVEKLDLWPAQWAVQASVDADRVENRLRTVTCRPLTDGENASRHAVESHLAGARGACHRRRGLRDKWRGTSVESTYLHLHSAKIFLIDLLPDAEFDALVPDVTTRMATVLDRHDPRRVEAEDALHTKTGLPRRAALKQAMETAYDASDEAYVRLRDFRNIIVLAAAAMVVFTALLVALVAYSPDAIPLCFDPGVTTAAVNPPAQPVPPSVCPSGDRQQPTSGDILIVAGLGTVGGALGALIAIRNLRGTSTPYSGTTALAILKIPSGALSAIIGMLLLAGGFVPGLTNLDNQRQILAYALVFGIAQQLVTRVADDRAQQILNKLPSKDQEAESPKPPSAPRPAPPPPADDTAATPAADEAPPIDGSAAAEVAPAADQETPAVEGDETDETDALEVPADSGPAPVQATGEFLSAAEVEDLTDDPFPLQPEAADELPPDDDGEPEITDDEAAQTGTDAEG